MALRIGVHEMRNELIALAIYVFFAGMVKVKLFQLISLIANRQGASRREINLDGVAIVDDVERSRFVIHFKRGEIGHFRVFNVDGRFGFSPGTFGISRIKFAPVLWIIWPAVGPMRRMSLLGKGESRKSGRAEHERK